MLDLLVGIEIPKMNEKGGFATLGRPKKADAAKAPKADAAKPATAKAAKAASGASPASFNPLSNYTAHARVRYIGRQRCECGKVTEYIAADLLEYSMKDRVAGVRTTRTRAFPARESQFAYLPSRLEYLEEEEQACAECLRLSVAFDLAVAGKGQLELPFDEKPTAAVRQQMKEVLGAGVKIRAIRAGRQECSAIIVPSLEI